MSWLYRDAGERRWAVAVGDLLAGEERPIVVRFRSRHYHEYNGCDGVSAVAHDMAMQQVVQAGAAPLTWLPLLLELQRAWARQQTCGPVMAIVKGHAGSDGRDGQYVKAVLTARGKKAA